MKQQHGKPYPDDDEFKSLARQHQSRFRENYLKVGCKVYGNILEEEDASRGLIFYDDFGILQAVRNRYGPEYKDTLYANLLRSEHIPFNFFVPMMYDPGCTKKVFNELVGGIVNEIKEFKIEWAPSPARAYLNDRTSIDTCIWYKHKDGQKGVFGIEVKYTERGYALSGETERRAIGNQSSRYWLVTRNSGLFIPGYEMKLVKDDFRQIWRNHLLGESMKQKGDIGHFNSITFYPEGNTHFQKAIPEYREMLTNKDAVIGITYENFFDVLQKYSRIDRYNLWIEYLRRRYLCK